MDTIITLSTTVDNRKSNDHQTTSMYNGNNVTISDKMYQKAIRALLWKLDKRLIPFLTILELFSFLNRINIGNAKIAGIENTLHLTQTEYSWAVSIYFIGFMLLEIPSTLIMRYIGPSKFLSIIMIIWGLIMVSMAFGYGISLLEVRTKLNGWQWIFILEGSPCVLLGIVTYFFLGDLPETVQWLTNTEKELLTNRLRQDTVFQIYRAEDAPYFIRSHLISLGFMVAMLFASLILKYILWRENQHRDHLSPEQRTRELTMCGQEPCDAHPDFRYVT
ncbi:unnamed protein product [Rotaria sordida]|uniref:Uncharacterized protein n=1 Tax=Rotaria sordida TaxID=392033 RepID=A0A815HIR3_9BILA|nr:unnamed protein product [Rotaria sordida]CAF1353117.1 unnamed protein product [Rotaria sordida]